MGVKKCQLNIIMDCVIDIWVELLKSELMTEEFIGESFTVFPTTEFIFNQLGRPRNLGGFGYGGWGWGCGAGIALGFIASLAVLSLFFW